MLLSLGITLKLGRFLNHLIRRCVLNERLLQQEIYPLKSGLVGNGYSNRNNWSVFNKSTRSYQGISQSSIL